RHRVARTVHVRRASAYSHRGGEALNDASHHAPSGWYRGRPALVLGGLGFIGRMLSRRLIDAGASVTIVTPLRSTHADDAADLESAGASVVEADIRDASAMGRAVRGQDVFFNLSARSGALSRVSYMFCCVYVLNAVRL